MIVWTMMVELRGAAVHMSMRNCNSMTSPQPKRDKRVIGRQLVREHRRDERSSWQNLRLRHNATWWSQRAWFLENLHGADKIVVELRCGSRRRKHQSNGTRICRQGYMGWHTSQL